MPQTITHLSENTLRSSFNSLNREDGKFGFTHMLVVTPTSGGEDRIAPVKAASAQNVDELTKAFREQYPDLSKGKQVTAAYDLKAETFEAGKLAL